MTEHFLRLDLPERSKGSQQQLNCWPDKGGDEAREQVINENLRLVVNIARRFAGRGHEFEDLFQIGTIGLMKAVDKFDPAYNVQFSTLLSP